MSETKVTPAVPQAGEPLSEAWAHAMHEFSSEVEGELEADPELTIRALRAAVRSESAPLEKRLAHLEHWMVQGGKERDALAERVDALEAMLGSVGAGALAKAGEEWVEREIALRMQGTPGPEPRGILHDVAPQVPAPAAPAVEDDGQAERAEAWMSVWKLCRSLGLDMSDTDPPVTGEQRVLHFIREALARATAAEERAERATAECVELDEQRHGLRASLDRETDAHAAALGRAEKAERENDQRRKLPVAPAPSAEANTFDADAWCSPEPPETVERTGGEASEADRLRAVIERDRHHAALGLNAVRGALASYGWLLEGRGSYEWDDDRWRDEFGRAVRKVHDALKPLAKIAADLSDSPATEEARRAALRSAPPQAPEAGEREPEAWGVEWSSHLHGRRIECVYLTPQDAKRRAGDVFDSYEPSVIPLFRSPPPPVQQAGWSAEDRARLKEIRAWASVTAGRERDGVMVTGAERDVVWLLARLSPGAEGGGA